MEAVVELQGMGAEELLWTLDSNQQNPDSWENSFQNAPPLLSSLGKAPHFLVPSSSSSSSSKMLIEGAHSMRKVGSIPVYLNVYDITVMNGCAYFLGLGVYHSGVQGQISLYPIGPFLCLFFISFFMSSYFSISCLSVLTLRPDQMSSRNWDFL